MPSLKFSHLMHINICVATRQNESSCGDRRFEIMDNFDHGDEKSRNFFFLHKSKVYHVNCQLKLQNP